MAGKKKTEKKTETPFDVKAESTGEVELVASTHLSDEGEVELRSAIDELDEDEKRLQKTRRLTYTLTADERQAKRVESAHKLGERVEVDNEVDRLTEQLKRMKKRSEAIDAEAVELLRVAEDGHELREIECVEVFDPSFVVDVGGTLEKGAVVTVRRDLWDLSSDIMLSSREREELQAEAIIESRGADKAVRQGSLFS